jgi:hypothetical protein
MFSVLPSDGISASTVSNHLVGPSTFKVLLEDGVTLVPLFAGGSDPLPAVLAFGLLICYLSSCLILSDAILFPFTNDDLEAELPLAGSLATDFTDAVRTRVESQTTHGSEVMDIFVVVCLCIFLSFVTVADGIGGSSSFFCRSFSLSSHRQGLAAS